MNKYLLMLFVIFFFSCESMKELQQSSEKTTAASSVQSGNTSNSTNNYDSFFQFMKRTWYAPPAQTVPGENGKDGRDGKDGAIIPYPVPIMTEEYGTGNVNKASSNSDSSWKNAFDSLSSEIDASNRKSQTQVLNWKHLLMLGIGIVIAIKMLDFFSGFRFRFTRK